MNWSSTRLKGMFACPNCNTTEAFRLKASRPFLTLYFVPIVPIGGLQEYVQCSRCKNAFETVILGNRMLPSHSQLSNAQLNDAELQSTAEFAAELLKTMALMMVEDGHVTENEIRIARRLYENITETNISRDELGQACSQVRLQRLTTSSFLTTVARRLNHEQKLILIQAMFGIAGADGDITPKRLDSLLKAKDLLGVDESEFQLAVRSTTQWLE